MPIAMKQPSPTGRKLRGNLLSSRLIRATAWIVALPVLCAVGFAGGLAPIYLLLPSDDPSSASAAVPAEPAIDRNSVAAIAPASSPAAPALEKASDPERNAAVPPSEDPPAEAADILPSPEDKKASQIAMISAPTPTPRPTPPTPLGVAERVEPSSVPVPKAGPDKVASLDKGDVTRQRADRQGNRSVINRTVNLRAAPWGRKIGVLDRGTAVVVGDCDGWCEVSVNGMRGWVHPSYVGGAKRAEIRQERELRPARTQERRIRRGRDGNRGQDRGWYREDPRDVEIYEVAPPDWGYDDDYGGPVMVRRLPPIRYRDPYPEFYR